MPQFRTGAPVTLTQEVHDRLIGAVSYGLRPETIANLARVHPNNLRRWLKKGSYDAENGISSEYAQLWWDFNQTKADKISQWLRDIEQRLPNWQAAWELVKSVAREDFGMEAVEYKELLEIINNLSEAFKRFKENPLQGAMNHGGQMDSESHSKT
jgi:hypothetical protein